MFFPSVATSPSCCLQQGFELVPLVIAVGDYVLTPEICVERKSLSDLFQSMTSGRLFSQVRRRHPLGCNVKGFLAPVPGPRYLSVIVKYLGTSVHSLTKA